jgi:hypothetical protein
MKRIKHTGPRLSEKRVSLTMPAEELDALNAYCRQQRRETGEPIVRADIIRKAIREMIAR